MGIKKLLETITEKAPRGIREVPLEHYAGRTVACNASLTMYQCLITTQYIPSRGAGMLTDEAGTPTAHLVGLFNRTIQFLELGIRPIWIFDHKSQRKHNDDYEKKKTLKFIKRKQNQNLGKSSEEPKFPKRSVNLTPEMADDAKKMLGLLGIPSVEAPGEAEAQCAEIVKAGKAFAVVSEDIDALTFGAKFLIKGMNNKREPVTEINLEEVLRGLNFTFDEFIDFCILLGCDYSKTIEGVGPTTAYKMVQQCSTIERVVEYIKSTENKRYNFPKVFAYEDARAIFQNPNVISIEKIELEWKEPDEVALAEFLVNGKGFNTSRIEGAMRRIKTSQAKPAQLRLESFFKSDPLKRPPAPAPVKKSFGWKKRKREEN
ncbi:unnamed protein product [Blepharisma stoltei]|uniref:Flap endonuclease 1 n=1 Tax=Blepharisma stoltei TaxID=1481888 RepID=A0AAU9IIR4_9CILI|nr:unnamed protein product [Blepharisma stoltei]